MDDQSSQWIHSLTVASTEKCSCSSVDQFLPIDCGDCSPRDTILPMSVLSTKPYPIHSIDALQDCSQAPHTLTLLDETYGQALQDGESLFQLGLTHLQNQGYPEAIEAFDQALNRYILLNLREDQVHLLSHITLAAYSNGDYHHSINSGQRTLVLAHEFGQHAIAITVLGTIGNAYRHLGNTDRASHFQHESLALAQKLGDQRGSMAALNNLGLVFKAKGDYAQAISYEKQALVLAQSLQDLSVEAQVLKNLGNAYYAIGESETAIDYYKERLVVVRSMKNPRLEIQVLKHLSTACYSTGRPTESIHYARDRFNLAKALEDVAGEERALRSMAIVYESLGQSWEAVEVHQDRLISARVLGDASLFLEVQADLKQLFFNLGAFDRANLVSQENFLSGGR